MRRLLRAHRPPPRCRSTASVPADGEQVVTPWAVEAKGPRGISYDRIIGQFQSERLEGDVLARLEAQQSPLHHFFRRGIAFSHRGLADILDEVAKGRKFFLYTGRGPSAESMHLGHAVPFMLTKALQDMFDVPLVIQMTDDEKFLFRDIPIDRLTKLTHENIKDILAFGFNPKRVFVFRNSAYMGRLYPNVLAVQRMLTANVVKNTLGLNDSDNVGKFSFAAIQAAPCFVSSFPNVLPVKSTNMRCLIPCAIDQDPFFVLTRGLCDRLKRPKPAVLHTTFLPALKGTGHKMSSSAESNGVVLLSDSGDVVAKKMRSAFSGGRGTLQALQEGGADLDVDVAYQYMRYFEPDDAKLQQCADDYAAGRIHSGDVKRLASEAVVQHVLGPWRARRSAITDDDVAEVMQERDILQLC